MEQSVNLEAGKALLLLKSVVDHLILVFHMGCRDWAREAFSNILAMDATEPLLYRKVPITASTGSCMMIMIKSKMVSVNRL